MNILCLKNILPLAGYNFDIIISTDFEFFCKSVTQKVSKKSTLFPTSPNYSAPAIPGETETWKLHLFHFKAVCCVVEKHKQNTFKFLACHN